MVFFCPSETHLNERLFAEQFDDLLLNDGVLIPKVLQKKWQCVGTHLLNNICRVVSRPFLKHGTKIAGNADQKNSEQSQPGDTATFAHDETIFAYCRFAASNIRNSGSSCLAQTTRPSRGLDAVLSRIKINL